jgi:hypothetical protein
MTDTPTKSQVETTESTPVDFAGSHKDDASFDLTAYPTPSIDDETTTYIKANLRAFLDDHNKILAAAMDVIGAYSDCAVNDTFNCWVDSVGTQSNTVLAMSDLIDEMTPDGQTLARCFERSIDLLNLIDYKMMLAYQLRLSISAWQGTPGYESNPEQKVSNTYDASNLAAMLHSVNKECLSKISIIRLESLENFMDTA